MTIALARRVNPTFSSPQTWKCVRTACRQLVAELGDICLTCQLTDAKREDVARRVTAVQPYQRGEVGATQYAEESARRGRNRDKILKGIVSKTKKTPAFPVLLADGLSDLLTRAAADSPAFARWLAAQRVTRTETGWACSRSSGRSAPSSGTARR